MRTLSRRGWGKRAQFPLRSLQAPHSPEEATPGRGMEALFRETVWESRAAGVMGYESSAGHPRLGSWMLTAPRRVPADMAESWLRLSGVGVAEEPGPEGGLEEPDASDDSLTSPAVAAGILYSQRQGSRPAPRGHRSPRLPPCQARRAGLPWLPTLPAWGSRTPASPRRRARRGSAPPGLQALPRRRGLRPTQYAKAHCASPRHLHGHAVASKATKITLSAIYKWITDNYFRHADPTWQVGQAQPGPRSRRLDSHRGSRSAGGQARA